jgi:hypothetical protein
MQLCDAVLDLVVQLLSHQQHWLCHERVIIVTRNLLGKALERWVAVNIVGNLSVHLWKV